MSKEIFTLIVVSAFTCGFYSCKESGGDRESRVQQQAEEYLTSYNTTYQELYTEAAEAEWVLNTRIVAGDTSSQIAYERTRKALADYQGSLANIDSARKYLGRKEELTELQARQFGAILFAAGASPATAAEEVGKLISVSGEQTKVLYGFDFTIDGKSVTKNDINRILAESNRLNEKKEAWLASKEVGKALKPGLEQLRELRNATVKGLGYDDFFSYQVSEYDMNNEELLAMTEGFVRDVWPLYRELHTWTRYELAKRYNQPVPEYLPAHWLPNQWGQDWASMVDVEGLNLDDTLKRKSPEWIVRTGEDFYRSLGFGPLPVSFYEKSSLYPLPPDATYKKNNHASAWHMDLQDDVRSLMSVEATTEWWETSLHELGHIYYYISYTTPEVPNVLRGGANRAYHEAIGSQIGMASLQKPLLESQGLIPANVQTNDTLKLLSDALNHIVVIPWGAGVMTRFEHLLYAENLPVDKFNATWWELKKKYQGIVPPSERGEEYCDACTKTHIIDDAAQYYDYAIAEILLFQFHDHIARNILSKDVHETNYWGSKETGEFLRKMMSTGATVPWREHLQQNLGTDVSAKPLLDYFSPLMDWLKRKNQGRQHTLPVAI